MKKIIMYTKNNCPNCNRAKFMLEACPVDVDLEIRNIEEDETFNEELKEMKSTTLPTLLFPYTGVTTNHIGDLVEEHGETYRIYRGWEENFGKIQEELGL